jgi:dihydroorotase
LITLIRGSVIVDPSGERRGDVLVDGERVREIRQAPAGSAADRGHRPTLDPDDGQVIDADGLVLMPAFVDLHAHFREPGYTY